MPERIDLQQVDDPRDVVHRAVACLAQGGLVGLPTESGPCIVASAMNPLSVKRLRSLTTETDGRPDPLPTLLLRGSGEVDDWANVPEGSARRLARRAWPGPVAIVFPIQPDGLSARLPLEARLFLVHDGKLALRSPSHRLIREILRLLPVPLIHLEPTIKTDDPTENSDLLSHLDVLEMILVAAKPMSGLGSTVVDASPEGCSISRPGLMSESLLAQLSGTIFLFVCTGNTCRSPMAEALCKALLARRLGCEARDLVKLGYVVLSAGVSASDGMPAAAHAVEVVRSRGGSLETHASRRALPDLVRHADHILAMTSDHLDVLLDRIPEVADRARLLDADGEDIDDPVGSDLATYQRTARMIENHLTRFLDQLKL